MECTPEIGKCIQTSTLRYTEDNEIALKEGEGPEVYLYLCFRAVSLSQPGDLTLRIHLWSRVQPIYFSLFSDYQGYLHSHWPKVNMELDLQSLFVLLCTAVLIGWGPRNPPPAFGLIYEGAIGQPR